MEYFTGKLGSNHTPRTMFPNKALNHPSAAQESYKEIMKYFQDGDLGDGKRLVGNSFQMRVQ